MATKSDTTVLITGASSGMGYEFARHYAQLDYNIIMVSLDKERLSSAAHEISKLAKGDVHYITQDLSKADSANSLYRRVISDGHKVDILINNAGFATAGSFATTSLDEEAAEMTLNMVTLTLLTKLFLKDMLQRKHGKILNVASLAATAAGPYMAVYYASKSYVLRFSEALHYELKDTNVAVSVFCPGPIATNFAKRAHLSQSRLFSGKLMSAENAVAIATNNLEKRKMIIFDSPKGFVAMSVLRFLPIKTQLRIARHINR